MTKGLRFQPVPILGHEPRPCPVCNQCRRAFHPDSMHTGSLAECDAGERAWLCSLPCLYAWRRGLPRDWRPAAKPPLPPRAGRAREVRKEDAEAMMKQWAGVPGASWADIVEGKGHL